MRAASPCGRETSPAPHAHPCTPTLTLPPTRAAAADGRWGCSFTRKDAPDDPCPRTHRTTGASSYAAYRFSLQPLRPTDTAASAPALSLTFTSKWDEEMRGELAALSERGRERVVLVSGADWHRPSVLLGAKWRRLGDQLGLKRTTTAELLQYFQLICSQPFGDLQL